MVELQPSKLTVGVQFSLPAPNILILKMKEKEIAIMCIYYSSKQHLQLKRYYNITTQSVAF